MKTIRPKLLRAVARIGFFGILGPTIGYFFFVLTLACGDDGAGLGEPSPWWEFACSIEELGAPSAVAGAIFSLASLRMVLGGPLLRSRALRAFAGAAAMSLVFGGVFLGLASGRAHHNGLFTMLVTLAVLAGAVVGLVLPRPLLLSRG